MKKIVSVCVYVFVFLQKRSGRPSQVFQVHLFRKYIALALPQKKNTKQQHIWYIWEVYHFNA